MVSATKPQKRKSQPIKPVAPLPGPVTTDHGRVRLRGETAHGCYERQTFTPQD